MDGREDEDKDTQMGQVVKYVDRLQTLKGKIEGCRGDNTHT